MRNEFLYITLFQSLTFPSYQRSTPSQGTSIRRWIFRNCELMIEFCVLSFEGGGGASR